MLRILGFVIMDPDVLTYVQLSSLPVSTGSLEMSVMLDGLSR